MHFLPLFTALHQYAQSKWNDIVSIVSDTTHKYSNLIVSRSSAVTIPINYIVVAAIIGSVLLGLAVLLFTLYLRSRYRYTSCLFILFGRGRKHAIQRDESFFTKPTPGPEAVPLRVRRPHCTPDDIIGYYSSDDNNSTLDTPDSPRQSSFVSVPYVPNKNYSRPSSFDFSTRYKHSSSSTYSSMTSLLPPQPSSPKRETFAQPVVRSQFPRMYQLHDPGFLPPFLKDKE